MISRRHILQAGALVAAHATLASAAFGADAPDATKSKSKTLLILGGTGFIGPHLTQEALRQGWTVTHFNRGKREPGGVSGVETLIGDRNGQIDALRGRKWDAVIDDSGYVPKFVRMSSELLAPNVGHYVFVSSISAYASFAKPNDESSPTAKLDNPDEEKVTNDTYGAMKAACEQRVRDAFGARASIVRPGYIVGPLDPTDRFTYWPVRASRGGEMLAPGTSQDPVQIIDARDLTAWMLRLAERRAGGNFNGLTAPGALTMGELIAACQSASAGAGTKVTWVPEDFLAKTWKPEDLDLPPWSPMKGEMAGASLNANKRSVQTGLKFRPLKETVRDTLAWFQTLPADRQAKLRAGVDPQKETEALAAWHRSPQA